MESHLIHIVSNCLLVNLETRGLQKHFFISIKASTHLYCCLPQLSCLVPFQLLACTLLNNDQHIQGISAVIAATVWDERIHFRLESRITPATREGLPYLTSASKAQMAFGTSGFCTRPPMRLIWQICGICKIREESCLLLTTYKKKY